MDEGGRSDFSAAALDAGPDIWLLMAEMIAVLNVAYGVTSCAASGLTYELKPKWVSCHRAERDGRSLFSCGTAGKFLSGLRRLWHDRAGVWRGEQSRIGNHSISNLKPVGTEGAFVCVDTGHHPGHERVRLCQ